MNLIKILLIITLLSIGSFVQAEDRIFNCKYNMQSLLVATKTLPYDQFVANYHLHISRSNKPNIIEDYIEFTTDAQRKIVFPLKCTLVKK